MTELICRVISISNKKTSMRLAAAEWEAIDSICQSENIKRNYLFELINSKKNAKISLTCSVRLFTIIYFYRFLLGQQKNYTPRQQPESPIFEAINGIL